MCTPRHLQIALFAICLPCFASAPKDLEVYAERAQKLVDQHRRAVARLNAPAERVAEALNAGGAFYLAGSDAGWISEGSGRAGGMMMIRGLRSNDDAHAADVVWLSYAARTYEAQAKAAAELERKKCLVMAFGPRPPSGAPAFQHWIDSLTPWDAEPNFTVMGNVLSLWTLTGEVAAATSRRGRTLAFYQSVYMPESKERNPRYQGRTFHLAGEPQMKPVQAGVPSRTYLDTVARMLRDIRARELDNIAALGKEMARRSASHPVLLMPHSHLMPDELWGDGKWFQTYKKGAKELEKALGTDGYFIWLGYYRGVPDDLWQAVRRAKGRAAWILVPQPGQSLDFAQHGDLVINQQWAAGDAAVVFPGYDVAILPPSGIGQLFVYEAVMLAAGARP